MIGRATSMTVLVGMVTASLAAQPPARADVSRLSWLEGRWSGVADGVSMEEQWTAPRGGALLGLHRDVKGERMVSFEFLRIETTSEGTFYFASPESRAERSSGKNGPGPERDDACALPGLLLSLTVRASWSASRAFPRASS